MLQRLTINNYALIDTLDISFPGGLVIITGETGAGKSILLGALSLLLGAKSDVSVIKDKGRNCVVEAEFEAGGEYYILRRVVAPTGRSRVFINDEPASIDQIKELSSKLIDIHAQNQHLLLSNPHFQLSVLDSFAGLEKKVEEYNALYDGYLEAKNELAVMDRKIEELSSNRDYIEYQYNKLEEAKLQPDELAELEQEQSKLANSEQIKGDLSRICSLFTSEESSITSTFKEIENILSQNVEFFPEFSSIADRVKSARIDMKDVEDEISEKFEGIVSSPERLAFVEDRLSLLYDLMRKYNADSIEALIEKRDRYSAELESSIDFQNERDALQKRVDELSQQCESAATSIHDVRKQSAEQLSDVLQTSIRTLEMENALFDVQVNEKEQWGRDGRDSVVFNFSANGGALNELSKSASGGELSRVMLCIKALLAKYIGMPTMIFDEIDTGVSGRIADKMGAVIGQMGENMQVFAITHLPQVASKGSAHFLVYKEKDAGSNVNSNIRRIDGQERIEEVARMLSGSTLTPEAVANAKVLLGMN